MLNAQWEWKIQTKQQQQKTNYVLYLSTIRYHNAERDLQNINKLPFDIKYDYSFMLLLLHW